MGNNDLELLRGNVAVVCRACLSCVHFDPEQCAVKPAVKATKAADTKSPGS